MTYDYREAVKDSILEYLEENAKDYVDIIGEDRKADKLRDDLWDQDSVTGNGSGSFYCNSSEALDAVRGNEDLLVEALEEFGDDPESYKRALTDPEYSDVTIRCYVLYDAVYDAIREFDWNSVEQDEEE